MKTNICALFWIIKVALPHLQPGVTIIATTIEQATDPTPDLYDYAKTKAAATSIVRAIGKQLASAEGRLRDGAGLRLGLPWFCGRSGGLAE